MTGEQELLLSLLVFAPSLVLATQLFARRQERRRAEYERTVRFVHWASTHERNGSPGVSVCGCMHCEQMRRDLGLQETWRWKKLTIPSRYT